MFSWCSKYWKINLPHLKYIDLWCQNSKSVTMDTRYSDCYSSLQQELTMHGRCVEDLHIWSGLEHPGNPGNLVSVAADRVHAYIIQAHTADIRFNPWGSAQMQTLGRTPTTVLTMLTGWVVMVVGQPTKCKNQLWVTGRSCFSNPNADISRLGVFIQERISMVFSVQNCFSLFSIQQDHFVADLLSCVIIVKLNKYKFLYQV